MVLFPEIVRQYFSLSQDQKGQSFSFTNCTSYLAQFPIIENLHDLLRHLGADTS